MISGPQLEAQLRCLVTVSSWPGGDASVSSPVKGDGGDIYLIGLF